MVLRSEQLEQTGCRLATAPSRLRVLFATGALVVACGGAKKKPLEPTATVTVSDKCPDMSKADEVAAFDFAKEYVIPAAAGEKLRAATLAAIEVGALADRLDADLGIACAQIAHDLGNKGDWRSGTEACAAAAKSVREVRAKLGPKAQTRLVVRAPLCLTDASLITKCASLCDASVPAEKVKAECTETAGRCDGNCAGTCEPKGTIKCEGVCSGSCDGKINGTCGGRCKGTCDGKPVNGACLGVCAGTCDRAMSGECKGGCSGSCKLARSAICDGTCSGGCSVELAEQRCAGELKTPAVSADCEARCDLALLNKTECSTPQVGLVIVGANGREAEGMKTAVDRALPGLLKILQELGEKAPKQVASAQSMLDGTRMSFKSMAQSGGKGTATASEAQLMKCFDEPFKKASEAAATAKAAIDQATALRGEVSK